MYWREIVEELQALLNSSTKEKGKQRKFDRLMLYLKNSPYLCKNKGCFDRRFLNQLMEPLEEKKTKTGVSYLPHAQIGKEGEVLETGKYKPSNREKKKPKRFRKALRKFAVKFKRFLDNSPVIEELEHSGAYFNKEYRIVTAEEKKEDKDDRK